MKSSKFGGFRVTSHEGKRIVTAYGKVHVRRIGQYTPKKG